jgi:hypothetical protein
VDIKFPTELQKYFESTLLQDSGLQGKTFTLTELTQRFLADPGELKIVLAAAVRKGLVASQGDDYQMLGISPEGLDSLFQHTSRAGLKPSSDVRAARRYTDWSALV